MTRNVCGCFSVTECKSECVDRASGNDGGGNGPRDIMVCSRGCFMSDHEAPNQPASGQILVSTRRVRSIWRGMYIVRLA